MRLGPSPRASTIDITRPEPRPMKVTRPYHAVLRIKTVRTVVGGASGGVTPRAPAALGPPAPTPPRRPRARRARGPPRRPRSRAEVIGDRERTETTAEMLGHEAQRGEPVEARLRNQRRGVH